ncbi:MAG: fibronectin type III domain-containing protein, partial [Patescibacteria group bacterium]
MPQRKMPTLIGLLVAALLVGAVIYFGERVPLISALFAKNGVTVQNIEITNISDISLTVSWTTQSPVIGDVLVSGGSITNRVALDDRDSPTKKSPTTTHHVTIRDLSPDTRYQVTLRAGGKKAEGPSQSATTGPSLPTIGDNTLGPAYGSVVTDSNEPANGALVYMTVEGGQTLSTLVTPSGSWLIPLNRVRSTDGTKYLETSERMTLDIRVRTDDWKDAEAITDSLNDSPVPIMTLGKSYDFRKQQAQAPKQTTVLGSSTSTKQQPNVSLIAPQDGSAIPSTKPLIHGTGIPGKTVVLTLGITNPYSDTTTVGGDGLWRYTPKKPLGIGKQSITMTTQDSSGKTVAVTHLFEILKSGTQVLGIATPSATLTISPIASPSPT